MKNYKQGKEVLLAKLNAYIQDEQPYIEYDKELFIKHEYSFPMDVYGYLFDRTPIEEFGDALQSFWDNLCHSFMMEKPTSIANFYEKLKSVEVPTHVEIGDELRQVEHATPEALLNRTLILLDATGWIKTSTSNKYPNAELRLEKLQDFFGISKAEVTEMRATYKNKRKLLRNIEYWSCDKVATPYGTKTTGLVRLGFDRASRSKFKYDLEAFNEFFEFIVDEFNVKLEKGESSLYDLAFKEGWTVRDKDITYRDVIANTLVAYVDEDKEYTLGKLLLDTRGRSIFDACRKIFNPVSDKTARSLLVTPPTSIDNGIELAQVFMAITELTGYKPRTEYERVSYGQAAYMDRWLPDLQGMSDKQDYDELHNYVWLWRIYRDLDKYYEQDNFMWTVGLECDSTASVLAVEGVLINDHTLLRLTNVLDNDGLLYDAWTIDGVPRKYVKAGATPQIYGSQTGVVKLWRNAGLEFTLEQAFKADYELSKGQFKGATAFKDFIIDNVDTKLLEKSVVNGEDIYSMPITVQGVTFTIFCNRFKFKEGKKVSVPVWDTTKEKFGMYEKNTEMTPDYKAFRRWFVTGLVHHLDSCIADSICCRVDWVLPNHDAFISTPKGLVEIKEVFRDELYNIYTRRHAILKEYFASIGIDKEFKDIDSEEILAFSINNLK